MGKHILVVDIGKTNIKLMTFDAALSLMASVVAPTPRLTRPYRAFDNVGFLAWLAKAICGLPNRAAIDHIVPIAHGAAFALLNGQDLVTPIMDYEAEVPDTVDRAYDAIRPDFAITGSPRLPQCQNAGRQLYWIRSCYPDLWNATTAIVPLPQYVGWCLTGGLASEVSSLGCHTDLWEPSNRRFSALAYDLGIAKRVPALLPAYAPLGKLTLDWRKKSGLTENCMVYVGAHDSNADLVPFLNESEPLVLLSTGTWVVAMALNCPDDIFAHETDWLINVTIDGRPLPTARFMGGRMWEARESDEKLIHDASVAQAEQEKLDPADKHADLLSRDAMIATRMASLLDHAPSGARVVMSGPFANNIKVFTTLQMLCPKLHFHSSPGNSHGSASGAAVMARIKA
jgi:L-fuculokinase